MAARAALQTIQIFNPYVNGNGSFNAYSYYDHGVETQENFRDVFPVTDQCERSAQLMGDDYVRLKFNLTAYVPMAAFSFIRYDGQTFFLMNDYCPHSNGSRKIYDGQGNAEVVSDSYEYDMKFYSVANMLRKPICYRHVKVAKGATAADGYHEWDEPEITVSATLPTMYVIIVQSIARYTTRLDSNLLLTQMLATIPTNGLDGIAPSTNVKLTADTELATFNFNGDKIADVCTTVANAYSDAKKETEWYIEEDANHSLTLHFCKCLDTQSMNHADDFSYKNTEGINRETHPVITGGLKKVDYSRDESNIPQVIIPYGSERNMTYQAVKGIDEVSQMQSTFGKRLRLKANHTCTVDGVTYPTAAMQAAGITGAYAVKDKDNNTVILGVDAHGGIANDQVNTGNEKVEYFDDVYPQCHFVVSKVEERSKKKDGNTIPEYTCEGIVVDAQGQIVQPEGDFYPLQIEEGKTLSVRFESGYLNGREFDIANKTQKKTNPSTGQPETNYTLRFVIVADGSIEDGTLIPSGNFKPRAREAGGYEGDKFALFNMKMPEAYITYAQEELAQKAYEKLIEYQDTVPDVKCTSDPDSFGGKDVYFGAQYTINSEKLGFTLNAQNRRVPIDFISRVVAYSYKLTKVNDVSFTLSSALVRGVLSEMAAAITNVSYATEGLGQRSINLSRRGWRDASEVADMITSMNTEMMLVGNEKYQFGYTSEILPLHTNGVFTGLKVSYGQLQHTQQPYIDYANGGLWQIQPEASLNADYQGNALDGTKPYYVFAVCGTDNLEWATVILMDKDAAETNGVYHKDTEISDQDQYPQYLLLGILSSEFAEEKNGQMTYERVFSPTCGFTAIEGGTITTEQIQDANRQLIIDFLSKPPRIIARGGAEIIGNITFKSFKDANGNEVTVGSRNLLRGTDWFDTDHYTGGVLGINDTLWSSARWRAASTTTGRETTVHTFSSGKPIPSISTYVKIKLTAAQSGWVDIAQDSVSPVKKGKTYMLSVYAKATTAAAAKIHLGAWTNSTGTVHSKADVSQDLTSSWKRYTFMFMWEWDEVPNIYFGLVGGAANDTLELCGMQLEESAFVSDWRPANEDTDSAIAAAQDAADDAMKKANNIVDDGIISGGTEKSTLLKEWQEIAGSNYDGTSNGSYCKATTQANAYGLTYTALTTAFNTLSAAMAVIRQNMNADTYLNGTTPPSGASILNMTKADFIALWRTYYDAEIALLNTVSDTIDQKEIGGENLYTGEDPVIVYYQSYKDTDIVLENGKKYVISVQSFVGNASGVKVYSRNSGGVYTELGTLLDEGTSSGGAVRRFGYRKVVVSGNGETLSLKASSMTGFTLTGVMVQQGDKPTTYQSSYKYLAEAFEHDATKLTTSIDGGLIVSALLKLINQNNQVTAGMSGLNGDNILQWGGATYADALNAVANSYRKLDSSLIPYLIRKDGLGKIGIFYINGDNVEINVPGQGKIKLDASSSDGRGIRIYDNYNNEIITITPRDISSIWTKASSSTTGYVWLNDGEYDDGMGGKYGKRSAYSKELGNPDWINLGKPNAKLHLKLTVNDISRISTETYTGATWKSINSTLYIRVIIEKYSTGEELARVNIGTIYQSEHTTAYGDKYYDALISGNVYEGDITFNNESSLSDCKARVEVYTQNNTERISISQVDLSNKHFYLELSSDFVDKKLIVAKDGIAAIYSDNNAFFVQATNSGQKILATGLPTSEPSTQGQLWNSGGFLKVKS